MANALGGWEEEGFGIFLQRKLSCSEITSLKPVRTRGEWASVEPGVGEGLGGGRTQDATSTHSDKGRCRKEELGTEAGWQRGGRGSQGPGQAQEQAGAKGTEPRG